MKQIDIGTCVPGDKALQWGPPLARAGYECLSINFHMAYDEGPMAEFAARVRDMAAREGTRVSSIGFYCNPLESASQRRLLEDFIDHARDFGTELVTTFAGALDGQPVEAALGAFGRVFGELCRRAADRGVRIALENCPMDGTWQRATCNIAFHPRAWERMFQEVSHPALGLEWEPAHQMVQLIDPLPQLKAWMGRIYHVHGKDATIDWDAVRRHGVFGACDFAPTRTPGFGDTNWRDVFFELYRGGYQGDLCVEGYHDPVYGGDWEMTGQLHALSYLKWCRGGEFVGNPW